MKSNQIKRIIELAKSYGATRLILFGSSVNEASQPQDVDLACDGIEGWKLYEFGARLEEELRLPLDLIPLTPTTKFTRLIEAKGTVLL